MSSERLFSAMALSIAAKTDSLSGSWLSLPRHLCDTAAVAEVVWDAFLPTATRRVICQAVGGGDEEGRRLAAFLAGCHDLGKATTSFQRKLSPYLGLRVGQSAVGLSWGTDHETPIPHGTLGQISMEAWFKERYGTRARGKGIAEVVGGHHGLNPGELELRDAQASLAAVESESWTRLRTELLDVMAERTGAPPYLAGWAERGVPLTARTLLLGIVILADWIASDVERFPFLDDRSSSQRANDAIDDIDLRKPWIPPLDDASSALDLLHGRFPVLRSRPIHPVQEVMVQTARTMDRPGLIILEAPMGSGKTEAAFLAAEILADRFGLGGTYIGLPTMATANPMFARTLEWLRRGSPASINLVHGKAALDETFAKLARESRPSQIFDESPEEGPSGAKDASVRVTSWFRGRKRSLFANHVVGTIDQSLMAALKAKHVVLRHLALSGKVVVIDEVHASDDYMRQYALRALEWFGAYGTPVILMSATLPPAQRELYLAAYARGRGIASGPVPAIGTPSRLTIFDSHVRTVDVPDATRDRSIVVEQLADDLPTLADLLSRCVVEGGCIAVIRNTVARAQETYDALLPLFDDHVRLFHSRFVAPQRAARERSLVAELGPTGDRPYLRIVVGTQVLEQSLDVDFDMLVTDLAPADLILQRLGRLHRHSRSGRPKPLRTARCYVTGADWASTPPRPVRGSVTIYGGSKLLRAAAVLGIGELRVPTDIPRVVADAYDPGLAPPMGWAQEWVQADAAEGVRSREAVANANHYRLGSPVGLTSLNGWIDVVGMDGDSAGAQGRSQVRDSEDGIEAILLQRGTDGLLRLPSGCGPLAGSVIPEGSVPLANPGLERAMAAATVALPPAVNRNSAALIAGLERSLQYDTWQASPWLAGQLALVIDASGHASVAGFEFQYSDDRGLAATRKDRA